jgi:hypothetical protein
MLLAAPAYQSSGACSDHSGRGVESESGVVALATTCPLVSISSAFAPVVETSMPSRREPSVMIASLSAQH